MSDVWCANPRRKRFIPKFSGEPVIELVELTGRRLLHDCNAAFPESIDAKRAQELRKGEPPFRFNFFDDLSRPFFSEPDFLVAHSERHQLRFAFPKPIEIGRAF